MAQSKRYETDETPETPEVVISDENRELAEKIVTQLGDYHEHEMGHRVELLNMGIFTTPFHKTKKQATADMVERVGTMLEDGSLVLSDSWVVDNLKS